MKQCTKCKAIKEQEEFYRHKLHKDGLSSRCKACQREYFTRYRQSERGKKVMKKYRQSEKGKVDKRKHDKKYRESEKGGSKRRYHRQTKKGRTGTQERISRWRKRHPERCHAAKAVQKAVEYGKMPPIKTLKCSCCQIQAEHYHHWSYKREHWLDVTPLCISCHFRIHKVTNQ